AVHTRHRKAEHRSIEISVLAQPQAPQHIAGEIHIGLERVDLLRLEGRRQSKQAEVCADIPHDRISTYPIANEPLVHRVYKRLPKLQDAQAAARGDVSCKGSVWGAARSAKVG